MGYCYGVQSSRSSGYCILNGVFRVLEFIMSVLVMGLTAYVENGIGMRDQQFLRLALATSVISTAYLIAMFLGTLGGGKLFCAAPVLFLEFSLLSLWASSFASLMHAFRHCDDWPSPDSVQGFYWIDSFVRRCGASKAAISFSIIAMVYFLITMILFFCNVTMPIVSSHGFRYLWLPVSSINATLERGTGLRLLKEPEFAIESRPMQEATSLESSNVKSEKIQPEMANPAFLQSQPENLY